MTGLIQESSGRIAFILAALYSQALTLDEFNTWLEHVIAANNPSELPSWVWDMLESPLEHAGDVMARLGFVPEVEIATEWKHALAGIAFERGLPVYEEDSPARTVAADALGRSPQVRAQFEAEFPFLANR